jgi:hypothetical protein
MERIARELAVRKAKGKYFSLAPQSSGRILKELYRREKIRMKSVDRNISSIAALRWGASKEKIKRCMSVIKEKGKLYGILDRMVQDDFFLDPVKHVEKTEAKSKYVYDITVEGTHVFVPNGAFVVSNCYNNQSFSNTGVQMASSTPFLTHTTTTPAGNPFMRKPMVKIMAAHGIPYAATACVSYPMDYIKKVQKAARAKGPAFIDLLCPCPTGWGFDQSKTIETGKLAVESGAWPLYEIDKGSFSLSYSPQKLQPIEGYLKSQRRFHHLRPEEAMEIQRRIEKGWELLKQGKFWEAKEY